MKRLIIAGSVTLATTPATLAAVGATGIAAGQIALYRGDTGAVISAALTEQISFFWIIGCCMQNYIAEYFLHTHFHLPSSVPPPSFPWQL